MLIKFGKLNITSDDIKNETDFEKLKTYKIEIDFAIADIKHQLATHRTRCINGIESGGSDWVDRAKMSGRMYGLLSQIIQQRMGYLGRIQRKENNAFFSRMFVENAKKLLSKEVFSNIFNETMVEISSLNKES